MRTSIYNKDFYTNRSGAMKSAQIIVPLIIDFLKPKSVVDVGCGTADFLKVFIENGVEDILGLDGSWMDNKAIVIPKSSFKKIDLKESIQLNRTFDLAMSLEVAEHLPKEYAQRFIDDLSKLSPVILFSAAIPLQGGTHHINEQWQDYWKNLFAKRNFVAIDWLRPQIWNNEEVSIWYAQNTLLYVRQDYLDQNNDIFKSVQLTKEQCITIVHPKLYLKKAKFHQLITGAIPKSIKCIALKILRIFKNG
ncbi:MAG: Glycosyl transferase family 2 [Parcubacteria group bacterium GW2011_GWA2_40_23]|nr:MAG: Glycosyl transferase family 2 [Parcubacteria group bacterium GW2011_GWA2_40_23]